MPALVHRSQVARTSQEAPPREARPARVTRATAGVDLAERAAGAAFGVAVGASRRGLRPRELQLRLVSRAVERLLDDVAQPRGQRIGQHRDRLDLEAEERL